MSLVAWPVPRGRREPPPETASGGSAPSVHRAGDEEWAGLRAFRDGDSPRQVAWPAYARGRGLLVKTYQSPAAHQRMFDLATVPRRGPRSNAWNSCRRGSSRPTRAANDTACGSRDTTCAPDSGNEHRARCLDGLALHGDAAKPW